MTITFLYSHTHTPASPHPCPACTQTQMGIMCSERDLNYTAWDLCLALSSLFFLHNKKATFTLYSFIALGKSRMVRLLVWVICPLWSWWAWDFQARERRLGSFAWGACGKNCRDLALWNPLWIPALSLVWLLHLGSASSGVMQVHCRKWSCLFGLHL